MKSEPALVPSPMPGIADVAAAPSGSPYDLRDVLDRVSDGFVALDRSWRYTYVNPQAARIFARTPEQLVGRHIWTEFPEGVGQKFQLAYERALAEQQPVLLEEYYAPYDRWFENRIYPSANGLTIYFHDITERKKAELLLSGQLQVLESISRGDPLDLSLALLVRTIEAQAKEMVCTILRMDEDGKHVRHGAAPSLPSKFVEAIDGAEIGPCAGSCGTAAHRRQRVVVEDIATDPLWTDWRDLVLPLGLKACWSTPIIDDEGVLLGTFAVYYSRIGPPLPEHERLVEGATHIAAVAITRAKRHSELRETSDRLHLAAQSGNVGLFDLDVATWRTYYSPEWKRQLGYDPHEISDSFTEWESRVHPDDVATTKERFLDFLSNPAGAYRVDFRLRHRDGTYRWIQSQAAAVRNEEGKVIRVLGSHMDITERKSHEREIERLNRLYAALCHVNQLLVRARSRAELFAEVTRIIVKHGGFLMAWIGWEDEKCERIRPVAHCGGDRYVEQLDIPTDARAVRGRGPTGLAYRENRPYVCNDFFGDAATEPWRDAAAARGFRSSAVIPIRVHDRVHGVLSVYAGETDFFQDREVALLGEAASDIAFAIEHLDEEERRGAAEAAVRESEARMRALALRLENIREQERTGIAREIHDVLAQELTKLKLDLVWLAKRAAKLGETGREALQARISDATQQTDFAITIVQRIATELRPVILDSLGLAAAIEWQVEDFGRRSGIASKTALPRREMSVPREQATAVFRILQESLTNVARHARATRVEVKLRQRGGRLTLEITDNGTGIRPEQVADPRSIGLIGMRERAQAYSGVFDVAALPRGGTRVNVTLPLP